MSSIAYTWGTTPNERARSFPCDRHMVDADDVYHRGVSVGASAEIMFRWLCQLRAAPYSYDWIDNLGRQSPQQLTPGLDELTVGQSVMSIFELLEFEAGRHLTIRTVPNSNPESGLVRRTLAGAAPRVAVTYLIESITPTSSRLLVKVLVEFPAQPTGHLVRSTLPWLDLIMMRRQLLNLRRLAERTQAS